MQRTYFLKGLVFENNSCGSKIPLPPDNFSNSLPKSCGTPVAPAEDEHPLKIFASLLAAPFIVFHCSMRHNRTSYTVNRIEGKWKFQIRVSFLGFISCSFSFVTVPTLCNYTQPK